MMTVNTMEVKLTICLLKDSHGNKEYVSFHEMCDTVALYNMKDKEGEPIVFIDTVHNLTEFCINCGIELRVIEIEDDFDKLWNKESL